MGVDECVEAKAIAPTCAEVLYVHPSVPADIWITIIVQTFLLRLSPRNDMLRSTSKQRVRQSGN